MFSRTECCACLEDRDLNALSTKYSARYHYVSVLSDVVCVYIMIQLQGSAN